MPLPDTVDHDSRHERIIRISHPFSKGFPAAFWCFRDGNCDLVLEHAEDSRLHTITLCKRVTTGSNIHLFKCGFCCIFRDTKWCQHFYVCWRWTAVDRKSEGFVSIQLPFQSLKTLRGNTLHAILSRCKANTNRRKITLRNPLLHQPTSYFLKCNILLILFCF